MKIFKYGLPLAALALMASCSSDNLDAPQGGLVDETVDGTSAYVSFNLALPGSEGTRAGEAYDEGIASEYAINNVVLYLYTKPSGGEITFKKRYQMGMGVNKPDLNNQNGITSKQEVTFQIDDIDEATKLSTEFYAFIVVNEGDDFQGPAVALGTWNQNAISATNRATKAAIDAKYGVNPMIPKIGDKMYFTMTNAPLWDGTNVNTLVKLEASKFATSPAAATQNAATVYVQRGVAKVSVSGRNIDLKAGVKPEGITTDKVKFAGWALDITNKTTYPVQEVEEDAAFANDPTGADWTFAHILGDNLASEGSTLKRIFWAKDVNYDSANSSDFFGTSDVYTGTNVWNDFGDSDWEYCLENTMNFQQMIKNETTRIVFKGTYCLGGDTDNPVSFVYFPGNDLATSVAGKAIANLSSESISKVDGKYKLSELITDEDDLEEVREALKCANDSYVYYYPGGETYYTALIRHFNDSQAALTDDGTSDGNELTINDADQYTKFQLGRYGIVRNNSYKVTVSKIMGFGSPTIPEPGDGPDDEPDPIKYNVVMEVVPMDWAVRANDNLTIK